MPVVTIEFVIPVLTDAVAEATRVDFVVYGGGGPPLPWPEVGMVHVASVCPGVQAAADEAINVSWPKLPVSIEVSMKRSLVVLT